MRQKLSVNLYGQIMVNTFKACGVRKLQWPPNKVQKVGDSSMFHASPLSSISLNFFHCFQILHYFTGQERHLSPTNCVGIWILSSLDLQGKPLAFWTCVCTPDLFYATIVFSCMANSIMKPHLACFALKMSTKRSEDWFHCHYLPSIHFNCCLLLLASGKLNMVNWVCATAANV